MEDSDKPTNKPGENQTGLGAESIHHSAKTHEVFVIVLALIFGLAGGLLTQFIDLNESSRNDSIEQQRQILLQEGDVIADIAERVGPSVVSISAHGQASSQSLFGIQTGPQESRGTGIILSEDGLIVTNKHVVPNNLINLTVVTSDGTEYDKVRLLDVDPFTDIAYLQIEDVDNLSPIELGDSGDVRVGQKVIAIGNALGRFSNTVTSGIISGSGRPIVASDQSGSAGESLTNLFQTDAAINPGNSGGPLVDINGRLIGINTAVAGNAENIGFAIPIDDVKSGIASVRESGELIIPYLGVRYIAVNEAVADRFDLVRDNGAYVFDQDGGSVLNNSPASRAGIENGDLIVKVAGEDVNETNSLSLLVGRQQVGETIEVVVVRDGKDLTLNVTLERAPDSL